MVIAIIAILAAMLMPALEGARNQARSAACKSNFRQIWQGATMYTIDNDGLLPPLNRLNYGCLGGARPARLSSNWWWGGSHAQNAVENGYFSAGFCGAYLGQKWDYDSSTNRFIIPQVMVCPGMQQHTGQDFIHCKMPGDDGWHKVGESISGGIVVGFGSFVGQRHFGNGVINTNRARIHKFRHASDEVVVLDLLQQEGNHNAYSASSNWTIPHPASGGKPAGLNQGFVDGSVRWFSFDQVNYRFLPAYWWDRQVTTPYHAPDNAVFNRGGYPSHDGWSDPRTSSPDWWGISNLHGHAYNPNP